MVSSLAEFTWRKSSRSNGTGQCVEVGWRKSSRSNGTGACVEVARTPDVTAVRDSKNPAAGALVLTGIAWAAFHTAVRLGRCG